MDICFTIETIDRCAIRHTFNVSEEPLLINNIDGIYYQIRKLEYDGWKHFVFKILFIDTSKILIYLIDNQDIPELSGKGIVKAMIEKLLLIHKKTIISSTNIDTLKVDASEGRVQNVTEYWKKWRRQDENISYNSEEDRFYFEYKIE